MFFAGITLFNPNILKLKESIDNINWQVEYILCIDNNSNNYKEIENLIHKYKNVILISNKKNMGIGYALNQMIKWGKSRSYNWLLALDQDSICPNNIIIEYMKMINLENIAIISPKIIDINKKDRIVKNNEKIEYIVDSEDVITSGSLINIDICNKVGMFNEKMFIDFVDTEYNKRILNNGYNIIKVNSVKLVHSVGNIKEYKFWRFNICCTNHSSFRRYYMVRNRLYYKFKYYGRIEGYKTALRLILGTIKIIIFEEEKLKKVVATLNGFRDYKKLLNDVEIKGGI